MNTLTPLIGDFRRTPRGISGTESRVRRAERIELALAPFGSDPELAGIELEDELIRIAGRAKEGRIEGGLVFGGALGFARSSPPRLALVERRHRVQQHRPSFIRHPSSFHVPLMGAAAHPPVQGGGI